MAVDSDFTLSSSFSVFSLFAFRALGAARFVSFVVVVVVFVVVDGVVVDVVVFVVVVVVFSVVGVLVVVVVVVVVVATIDVAVSVLPGVLLFSRKHVISFFTLVACPSVVTSTIHVVFGQGCSCSVFPSAFFCFCCPDGAALYQFGSFVTRVDFRGPSFFWCVLSALASVPV